MCGQNLRLAKAHLFISVSLKMVVMSENGIEILFVEDNLHDAEMTIRALRKINLANNLVHVQDGEEALDFLNARGKFSGRSPSGSPKLILLDIKMPKVDGIEVLRQLKS